MSWPSSAAGASSPPARSPSCARGGRRWRVDVEGVDGRWVDAIPQAAVVAHDASGVVLELTDGADEQAVLDAARAAGRVRRFTPVEATLSELFREVVA
jgi:ABC-2 type transport system ATP-binding protein